MVPDPRVVGDHLSTRLPRLFPIYFTRVPCAAYFGTSFAAALWSGGGSRLTLLVLALHPTGSHCAESSAPFYSLCGTGFILFEPFGPAPVLCLRYYFFYVANFNVGNQTFRPPGAGNRPFSDSGRGHHTHCCILMFISDRHFLHNICTHA